MTRPNSFTRRSFLSMVAATPLAAGAPLEAAMPSRVADRTRKPIPVGLELYSVRDGLKKDLAGTVREVAKIGYQCVEFYAPYYDWTPEYARQVRKELDDLGIRCYSTHNEFKSFTPDGIGHAVELNKILGARYIVLAHPGEVNGIDGWKRVADTLNTANHTLAGHGMHGGYHNHDLEWKPVDGQRPMDLLAANTDKSFMLQLDVGTCIEAGSDPVAWIEKNPGRIRSMHAKEWSPAKGYHVLLGEGVAPWKRIFAAAEHGDGIEFYLIEQEGSDYSEMETAERCLKAYHQLRA